LSASNIIPNQAEPVWRPNGGAARWLDKSRLLISFVALPLPFIADVILYIAGGIGNPVVGERLCTLAANCCPIVWFYFDRASFNECIGGQPTAPLLLLFFKLNVIGAAASISCIMLVLLMLVQNPIGKAIPGYRILRNRTKAAFYTLIGASSWIIVAALPLLFIYYFVTNSDALSGDFYSNVLSSVVIVGVYYPIANCALVGVGLFCFCIGRKTNLPPYR
jgi:hypothetical protein